MSCKPTNPPPEVDIAALSEKYLQERDKRVRRDGESQYIEVSDEYSKYYETDPYTPISPRTSKHEEHDVVILGGGFAGLIMAARLKQRGVDDIRIVEMGGDFGGTWYWNRYPGVQCDIESYCYLPLLEEVGYMPKEKYSYGDEIYEHCQRIGDHYDLYENALFHTMVRSIVWDEASSRWVIATDRGDELRARFLVMATGPYNRPKLPGIKGIHRFEGHDFHTSRWDYEYTGGDITGGLEKLRDKNVAIIGTGATGIQCAPFVGKFAKHLYVFQRTPSAVGERLNAPTDATWYQNQAQGWQRARQKNLYMGTFEKFYPGMSDLVCDGWTEINRNLAAKVSEMGDEALLESEYDDLKEYVDYQVMERLRNRVEQIVDDTQVAEILKPWFRFMCKRPTFNDDYLATFNRDNVTLVDVSETQGVEEITAHEIVTGGKTYPVDCIIYASGFEITTEMKRRIGIDIVEGRSGLSLYDHWAGGFKTFHGQMTHGFPNQFFMGFFQGGVSVNVTEMYEQQAENISYIIAEVINRDIRIVEPSQQAQDTWVKTMRDLEVSNQEFLEQCTPGYYNNEGSQAQRSHLGEVYGLGFYAFDELLASWRDEGKLRGLELTD